MRIFVSDIVYMKVYLITSGSEFPAVFQELAKYVGAPEVLVADPHRSNKS